MFAFRYPEALADKSFDNTGREDLPWTVMQDIFDWLNRFTSSSGSAIRSHPPADELGPFDDRSYKSCRG